MNLEGEDLFTTQHFHGDGGIRLQFRQALHVLIHILHGFAIDLLDNVATADTCFMGWFASDHDVGTKTRNTTGTHDIGHET